jgi:hypothetical protein
LTARYNRSISEFIASIGLFSEFNYMGAYAFNKMNDRFHWIDTEHEPFENLPLKQYWSHGGIQEEQKKELVATISDWNSQEVDND